MVLREEIERIKTSAAATPDIRMFSIYAISVTAWIYCS